MSGHRVVVIVHQDGERLPMVVDRITGIPNQTALEYLTYAYRGAAPNTIRNAAAAIALALDWGRIVLPLEGLVARLLGGKLLTAPEMSSLSEFLRRSAENTKRGRTQSNVAPQTHFHRLTYVKRFCIHVVTDAARRIPLSDPTSDTLAKHIEWFERSFDELGSSRPIDGIATKSLGTAQASELLEIIQPDHPKNPFKSNAVRIRNRSIVEVMYYLGLRPGELLNLHLEDVSFGPITGLSIRRRPHDPTDPRPMPPAVKRKGRVMSIDHLKAAKHLREYIDDIRSDLVQLNPAGSPFLFLNTSDGSPMTTRMVQKVFSKLAPLLGSHTDADGMPATRVTPSSMRHTYSNTMEEWLFEQGVPEEERRQLLMQLRGDSSPRSVEPYIQRTLAKRANAYQAKRMNELFLRQAEASEDVGY